MARVRLLMAFGLATCALAATATPALATFLVLLAEGTKELATKIRIESKGEGEEFKAGGGIMKCTENQFYGTEELKGHETNLVTVLPWFHDERKGCVVEGVIKGSENEVHHNGCDFIFRQVAKGESPEKEPYSGAINLECSEGKEIEYLTHLIGCAFFVGKKGNRSINGTEYLNLPEVKPLDVRVAVEASNISYHDSGCIGVEKEGRNAEYIVAPPGLVTAHNSAGTTLAIHVDPFTEE